MSLSEQLSGNLPYLRRYARALCGTQAAGDSYVAATLEAIVADPALAGEASTAKTALFGVFSRYWNSMGTNTDGRADGPAMGGERSLEAITPLPRQAFLLTSMEGFSEAEAAEILGVDVNDVRDLVARAGQEMSAHVATDVLIIEDEPLIAMDLESLVEGLGHRVTSIARTHTEAVAAAGTEQPGLILADIQLADGSSGLDAANELLNSFTVPVIFVTAYPERLLTGSRPEPAFLLTKPYNPSMLAAIISQALFFEQNAMAKTAA